MSQAITQYLRMIEEQRKILDDWTAYEYDLNEYWRQQLELHMAAMNTTYRVSAAMMGSSFPFDQYMSQHSGNLDLSEKRLKTAAAMGHVVDLTDTPVGHDIITVANARHGTLLFANKQRARDNLARMDIYEKLGKLVPAHVTKLTILQMNPPSNDMTPEQLHRQFINRTFDQVTLVSLDDPNNAMIYRLAI